MEFFNFVETFFFISLAITFILIMMLVYHFKERLSVLEQKTNTMFDIINNIVQEIQGIKNCPVQIHEMPLSNNIPFSNFPIQNIFSQMNDKIVVSEDENDDDENDDDENDDDDDDDSDEESDNENIKRINIDLSTSNDETVDDIQVEELDEIEEMEEMEEMDEMDEIDMYDHSETKEPEKKEEPVSEIIDSDSYRKMDINALRTLVITKGLAKDTRKMKKMDLIRLLDPTA